MNIYDILSADQVTVDTLYNHESIIRKEINTIDNILGPPITYYCDKHLKSAIDPDVIETLITKFNANINLESNHQMPLDIILRYSDPQTIKDNIRVIKILLKYTKTLSFVMKDGSPNLFVRILLLQDLFPEDNILQNFAAFMMKGIEHKLASNELNIQELSQIFYELHNGLLHLHSSAEHIILLLHMWNAINTLVSRDLQEKENNLSKLFVSAVNNRNFHLIKVFFTLEMLGDLNIENRFIQWMYDAYSDPDEQLQLDNALYESLILDQTIGNNIVIHGIMLNIHNIDKYIQYYNPERRDNLLPGITVLDQFIKNGNHEMAKSYLGFNNNIFHFLALYRNYITENLRNLFPNQYDLNLLLKQNSFGQTPLKIALLCNNYNFIVFIVNKALENKNFASNLRNTFLDDNENTVGHILAQTLLPEKDLINILLQLEKIGLNTVTVLTSLNKFKQTPADYAVINNNIVFIRWWQNNNGIFDSKDSAGRTLWHSFAQNYIDQTDTSSMKSIKQIYEILWSVIPQLVHNEDNQYNRPIDTAIACQSSVFELLLNDHADSIDFQHQNKNKDTISHIINHNFIIGFPNNNLLITQKEIVALLIPYHEKIKANYNIINAAGKRPIDILESGMQYPLAVWIHDRISHSVLKQVAILNKKYDGTISTSHTGSSIIPLFVEDKIKMTHNDKKTKTTIDNNLIIFSDDILQESAKIDTIQLPETIKNQIRALSLDIAYSNVNEWEDKIPHYLISTDILGISTELTFMHLMHIIDSRLANVILDTHNALGQYLIHLGISANYIHAVKYLLKIKPQLINKPTAEINLSFVNTVIIEALKHKPNVDVVSIIKNMPKQLYPSDYAATLFSWREKWLMDSFLEVIRSNKQISILAATLIDNTNVLFPYLNDHNTHFSNEYTSKYKDIIFARNKSLKDNNKFFPTLIAHVEPLKAQVRYIVHDTKIQVVPNLESLEEVLKRYVNHFNFAYYPDSSRIKFLVLAYNAHASALVIFRAKDKTYHVLIQDQYIESFPGMIDAYKQRTEQIKKLLFEQLRIPEKNIYEFKILQQHFNHNNCMLWTLANLKIIESNFFFKRFFCLSCIDTTFFMVLHDNISKMILEKISQDLINLSPEIVHRLQSYLTKCHNSFCALDTKDIDIDHSNLEEVYNKNIPLEPPIITTYKNVVPSDQNIRDIINHIASSMFAICNMDPNYESSNHRMIVIPSHENGLVPLLVKYIDSYIEYNKNTQEKHSTCTFIININNNWVTLVISYKNSQYKTYYADSLAQEIPSEIVNISQRYSVLKCKAVLSTPQHYDYHNSGFLAIQNALNINIILRNMPNLSAVLDQDGLDSATAATTKDIIHFDCDTMREEYKEILAYEAAEYNIVDSNLKFFVPKITYDNIQLSDQNIREITSSVYGNMFTVHLLGDYDTSDHSLIVVDNSDIALQTHIQQFLIQHHNKDALATRTFIINQDRNHWVTLVIAVNKNNSAAVYFADSFGHCMPQNIHQVIELCLSTYHNKEIFTQVVEEIQQNNIYDCGFWAIQNAVYINRMLIDGHDLFWLAEQIARNTEVDFRNIRVLRKTFQTQIEEDYKSHDSSYIKKMKELKILKDQLGFNKYSISCINPSSVIPLERTKRSICEEEKENTEPIIAGSIDKLEIPTQINMPLYFNIAYLAALQDPSDNKYSKIDNTLKYITNIYDILSEGAVNHSKRETKVLIKHYKNINELLGRKDQLLSPLQDIKIINSPTLFYNDDCSLIISYEDNHYLIYSQNYNYGAVYKTKADITLHDIKKYVSLFFSIYSRKNLVYHICTLADNLYTHNTIKTLENSDIWKDNESIKSDLRILWKLHSKGIDNIPIQIIREIFLVNGQVPDMRILNPDFFPTNHRMISLRIDQIHKAFLYLNSTQLESLKTLIKKYQFTLDDTYLKKLDPNKSDRIQFLINQYHQHMVKQLHNIEKLTIKKIQELTWEILDDLMKSYDISSALRAASIHEMQRIHQVLIYSMILHGDTITQGAFFIPDLIKAVNYNKYIPFMTSVTMSTADMTANQLYGLFLEKMEKYIDLNTSQILKQLPVTNPIFKMLTIYSIKKLREQLGAMDITSKEYLIVSHKLKEEYATFGLMTLECFNIEVTPLWFMLMIEKLYSEGHELALTYNLDIPEWQEPLMALGFYQDKINMLIQESNLINYNLLFVDSVAQNVAMDKNYSSSSLLIIKIPVLGLQEWISVNASHVPDLVKEKLKPQLHVNPYSSVYPVPTYHDIELSKTYNGMRLTPGNYSQYEQVYYKVSQSNTELMFHNYNVDEYKKPGTQDVIFADQIQIFDDKKWLRLPPKYETSCTLVFFNCRPPAPFLLHRDTGYAALYYSYIIHKKFGDQVWEDIKNIIYIFDSREGNMNIRFTQEWNQQLRKYVSQIYLHIIVMRKSYPDTLSFDDNVSGSCKLSDDSDTIIPEYFIMDNSSFTIEDNTNARKIIATQINNSDKTIITGNSSTILFNITHVTQTYHSQGRILSDEPKKQLHISLSKHYFIGSDLLLSDNIVYIDYVQGHSNNSHISFSKQNREFELSLIGNIIVHDYDHSMLTILGKYKSEKMISKLRRNKDDSSYILSIQDFSSIFKTIRSFINQYDNQVLEFNDIDGVKYNWEIIQKYYMHVFIQYIDASYNYRLQLSSEFNMLTIFDNTSNQWKLLIPIIYNTIFLSNDRILKHIFINSDKSFEPTNVIQNINNNSMFSEYDFLLSMNGSILLFTEDGHEHYIAFPFTREMTINNIYYQITEDKICYIKDNKYHNDNTLLRYVIGDDYRTVESCDYYRTTRHIQDLNYNDMEQQYSSDHDRFVKGRAIEDKRSNRENNQEEYFDSNNNAQPIYSSASRLEFGLTSIINSIINICSTMIGVLKRPNAHALDQIVQSEYNIDFEMPRLIISQEMMYVSHKTIGTINLNNAIDRKIGSNIVNAVIHNTCRHDIEDTLRAKDNCADDRLMFQDNICKSDNDSRLNAIVQVQNPIGINEIIKYETRLISGNVPKVIDSANSKFAIDLHGNLLLARLLCWKKHGSAKCTMPEDVTHEPIESKYAHMLAYSSYAPVIGENAEYTEQ